MALYTLINEAMVSFIVPVTIAPQPSDGPIPLPVVKPEQSFQLTVHGNPGVALSATCQLYVSNDDGAFKNWAPYFDPVTVSGTGRATAGFGGSQFWKYFSATLPAISGTGAKASLVMNG